MQTMRLGSLANKVQYYATVWVNAEECAREAKWAVPSNVCHLQTAYTSSLYTHKVRVFPCPPNVRHVNDYESILTLQNDTYSHTHTAEPLIMDTPKSGPPYNAVCLLPIYHPYISTS